MTPITSNAKRFAGRRALILAAATAAALTCGTLLAAPPPAPLINPGGAFQPTGASSAPRGEGLASLDDRALASELSSRGINNLLDDYFKTNNTSQAEQAAIKNTGALRELLDTSKKIPYGEKLRRVRQVAEGINAVLPTLKDPEQMMLTAGIIIEFGVQSDVNNIEYWGEDPVTQAQPKPMTSAVLKLYDDAGKTAKSQADELAKILKGGNDPNGDRWTALDNLTNTAAYSRNMSVYFDGVATSQKDPTRKAEADAAIAALKDFDNNDSGVQARIRNMLAKLQMVSGDYPTAQKTFESVYSDKTDVKPEPNPFEQYEARYFAVVSEIMEKNLTAAQKDKAALDGWQTSSMPALLTALKMTPAAIAENDKAISAAGQMLQWRVHVLEGDLAKDPAAKKKAEDSAEAVLLKLRDERPDLAPRIDQQLVNRMPANKKIDDSMPASLLLALLKKGMNESYKSDADKPDLVVINKGIEAAEAIIHRKDRKGLTDQNMADAQLAIASLQERLGKKIEAVNSYLDFAANFFKTDPSKATAALDRAGYFIFDMKKQEIQPPGFPDAYNRFLPIAIQQPYNHTELAYLYGEQLRGVKNFKDALKFFRMVPASSPAFALAQYKQMVVLDELRDTKQEPAEKTQTIVELTKAAEEVRKLYGAPKDDADRTKLIKATFTLADVYREQKDPKQMLAALQGIEGMIDGLSDGKTREEIAAKAELKASLKRTALVTQIHANMGVGQINEAVQQVTKLLQTAKGDDGISLVRELLAKLDEEYIHADLIHDTKSMRETAKNEASLTHYLVDWSNPATQKDPNVSKFYYAYAVYDARTQRLAGSLVEDPAEKKKLLTQAAARYRELQSKPLHDLYISQPDMQQRIKEGKIDATEPDSQVSVGLALTEFDLGDFKNARDDLDVLISNKKLGTPQSEVVDPKTGEVTAKDNDLYWEATAKFLMAGEAVAKGDAKTTAVVVQNLKNILIRGGIPERWQDEFEQVRKDLAPDFNPNVNGTAAKPAATATQPAASAAK